MTIKVKLNSGESEDICAKVDSLGAVATYDSPPVLAKKGTRNRIQFFRTVIGDMNIDGSTLPVTFTLSADDCCDIFITQILLSIEDTKVKEEKYGDIASLTTGVDLLTFENGDENFLIEKGKNYAELRAQIGDSQSDVKIKTSGAEIGLLSINLRQFVKDGIRLGRESKDSVKFIVNDDLTGLTGHTIYFLGYKHVA